MKSPKWDCEDDDDDDNNNDNNDNDCEHLDPDMKENGTMI
jgi:hypothetical protein